MKYLGKRRAKLSVLAATFALMALSTAAVFAQSTEYIIFDLVSEDQNTVDRFQPGSVLKDGDKIELPENATLKLLDKSGKVVVLNGPLVGTVLNDDGDSEGSKNGSNALQVIAKLMFGGNKLVNNLGAARTIESEVKEGEISQPWLPIIATPGTYCLPFEAPVIARTQTDSKTKVTVLSKEKSSKDKAWEAKEETISIVDLINSKEDKYTLFLSNMETESTLHLLDRKTMNVTEQIAWMAEHGCSKQAVQLLKEAAENVEEKDG